MFIEYYFERGKTATEQTTATDATTTAAGRRSWRVPAAGEAGERIRWAGRCGGRFHAHPVAGRQLPT